MSSAGSIPHPHRPAIRLFFFWTGIVATFAYRIINILSHVSAAWVTVAWYVGTVGFILYFAHRYQVAGRRAKLILDMQLEQKVAQAAGLTRDERRAMSYVFGTLQSSKEKWNYIFIFLMSGVALLVGIILDIQKIL
ncbi:MAG: hypothetical protein HY566_00100 [Candidatus Kerfeldbacteria bacterium]|nr:hypothetical protein [Candidatus Kerfeldbacteria bacterium]